MNMRFVLPVLMLAVSMPAATGCVSSAKPAASAPATVVLADAYAAWKANDAQTAYVHSKGIAGDMRYPDATRQEAAYVAGKAARKLDRRSEAATLLGQAAQSPDKLLRGQALAEQGMTLNELQRFKEGAAALLKATDLLEGEERSLAYFHAGIAEQKLNYWSDARIHLTNAMRYTADAGLKADIRRQIDVTGYTLQVGSFADADNARRVCGEWRQKTQALRLADPRIVKAKNAVNQDIFVVQVGQFSTYDSARARQGLLGANGGLVVPLWGN